MLKHCTLSRIPVTARLILATEAVKPQASRTLESCATETFKDLSRSESQLSSLVTPIPGILEGTGGGKLLAKSAANKQRRGTCTPLRSSNCHHGIFTDCAAQRKIKDLTAKEHGDLKTMKPSCPLSGRLSKQATQEQAAKGAYSLLVLIVAKDRLVDGAWANIAC